MEELIGWPAEPLNAMQKIARCLIQARDLNRDFAQIVCFCIIPVAGHGKVGVVRQMFGNSLCEWGRLRPLIQVHRSISEK